MTTQTHSRATKEFWKRSNFWKYLGDACQSENGPVLTGKGPWPRPQWVKFASPHLAPTAPTTTVFIALISVCQIVFSESALRVFNGWGQGQDPFLLLHCTRSAVPRLAMWVQTVS